MRPSGSSLPVRIVAAVVAAAWATLAAVVPAAAAPPGFEIGPGLPTVGNFAPVTLNGTDQLTSASIAPFVVTARRPREHPCRYVLHAGDDRDHFRSVTAAGRRARIRS